MASGLSGGFSSLCVAIDVGTHGLGALGAFMGQLAINQPRPSLGLNVMNRRVPLQWPSAQNPCNKAIGSYLGALSWMGSIMESQRDASGLDYMRNRVYDSKTGRFTQEDPIGLAGGLNLYGYAGGDPVNFSDPFGLCPNKEDPRCSIGQQIRAGIEATFDRFLEGMASVGQSLRQAMPGLARDAAVDLALAAVPVVGEVRGARRVVAVVEGTGQFLTENRHVRGVVAARKNFARIGASADEVGSAIARSSGWEAVSEGALAGGQLRIGRGTVRYTLQNLGKETVFNAWIP